MLGRFRTQALLLRAGISMTLLEVGLRLAGMRRCVRFLDTLARHMPFALEAPPDADLAQQIADIVDRAARTTSLYPVQCLPRSLALAYFLKRYGQPGELKLGVQTITGEFRSHAWVECLGRELNESPPARELYVPLDWNEKAARRRRI